MKKLRKIDKYLIPTFVIMAVAVALRVLALLTSFNSLTMHFDNKTVITIANALIVIASAGSLSYLFLGEAEQELIAKGNSPSSYIPAGLVGLSLIFMGARLIAAAFGLFPSCNLPLLLLLCGLLAICAALSFFLSVFIEKRGDIYKSAFSLCIVLFLALYAVNLFFTTHTHPTNSPNKLVDQLAMLSAAIFFLFEARINIGRIIWRGYVSSGIIAALLTAYSALPSLIVYIVNGYTVSDSIIETILTLLISLFISIRLLTFYRLTPRKECDEAGTIALLAKRREDEMRVAKDPTRAQDNDNEESADTDALNYTMDIPFPDSDTDFSIEGSDAGES